MARLLVGAAVLGGACGSLVPRPFGAFRSEPVPERPGVRRFRHEEAYRHSDGSDLWLSWQVDTDPTTIYSVDAEHRKGARVLECGPTRLTLRVPGNQASNVQKWKHVVASDTIHNCEHLPGQHLYHAIENVENVRKTSDGSIVVLTTKDLPSPSHIFHNLDYSVRYVPAETKDPEELARDLEEYRERRRRLTFEMHSSPSMPSFTSSFSGSGMGSSDPFGSGFGGGDEHLLPRDGGDDFDSAFPDPQLATGDTQISNTFTPTMEQVDGMLDLSSPKEVSKLHWNWNYDADCTDNPEFEFRFPGGEGWIRFYKPYVKAQVRIGLNFTSELGELGSTPHEKVTGEMDGYADMRLDIATAVDFTEDAKMSPLNRLQLPFIGKATQYVRPIRFFLANTPIKVDPGFSCHLNAYHVGRLEGSLRVSLDMKLTLKGKMTFDTVNGLSTNFSAKARDVKFTPPTWMVFTKHFELGAVLEPEIWLKGGMGTKRDMKMGWGFRPYVNVSIMEKGYEARRSSNVGPTPDVVQTQQAFGQAGAKAFIVYPYRVVGLPSNQKYAVRITVASKERSSAVHLSTNGVLDYDDDVAHFLFEDMSEEDVLSSPIQVDILQYPQMTVVGSGQASCSSISENECQPGPDSPIEVPIMVGSNKVDVLLSTAYMADPKSYLTKKVRGVSFNVTELKDFTPELQKQILAAKSVELRVSRNGRVYILPMVKASTSTDSNVVLRSDGVYNMGLRFLDAFKVQQLQNEPSTVPKPSAALYVDGQEVGTSPLPPVKWSSPKSESDTSNMNPLMAMMGGSAMMDAMTVADSLYGGGITTQHMPVDLAMETPGTTSVAFTGALEFRASDPEEAAYWIYPFEATTLVPGSTKQLHWTIHTPAGMFSGLFGGGKKVNFELIALEAGSDGSLTQLDWKEQFPAGCAPNFDVSVHTYTGEETPCMFSYDLKVPSDFSGKTVFLEVGWFDPHGEKHRMLSSAVTVASRRLGEANAPLTPRQLQAATNPWSLQQSSAGTHRLGWQNSNGVSSQQDFQNHMQAKAAQGVAACDQNPLEYSVGFGVLEREDLKGGNEISAMMDLAKDMALLSGMGSSLHQPAAIPGAPQTPFSQPAQPMMPGYPPPAPGQMPQYGQPPQMPGQMPRPASTSSFGSGPKLLQNPLAALLSGGGSLLSASMSNPNTQETQYQNLMATNMNQTLADLLPESLCSGGICSGELPGCKPKAVKPIAIKEMVFRLSRFFKIEDLLSPELRAAFAYGLAVAPEAIEVGEEEIAEAVHEKHPDLTTRKPTTTERVVVTNAPSASPTSAPTTEAPTAQPTSVPTLEPEPQVEYTATPTATPTAWPTASPTPEPSQEPAPAPAPAPAPEPAPAAAARPQAPAGLVSPAQQSALEAAEEEKEREAATRRLDAKEQGRETKTLVVRVNRPMLYRIDEKMIGELVERGSFDLLSDGREATLGPVKIESVVLRDRRDGLAGNAADDSDEAPAASASLGSAATGAGFLGLAAAFAAAGALAMRVIRRPPYRAVSTEAEVA
eukprot:TRINITY_DN24_c0_g1_i1.p1 TRINITY_DN24_c0_g1~~TRINITY_DN24_c0_g1_i1.p1  ORF type:complete len:1552 (+),score=400.81 TRINITY_DN24_c0_g1_i1:98-4657(+)